MLQQVIEHISLYWHILAVCCGVILFSLIGFMLLIQEAKESVEDEDDAL